MAFQGAKKISQLLSFYCILTLFYSYNAVTVKKTLLRSSTRTRKRSPRSNRHEASIVEATSNDDRRAVTSEFVSKFEEIIKNEDNSNKTAKFAAILLKQGKIYCRLSQKDQLFRDRGRYFVQMLKRGLKAQRGELSFKHELPILLKHDDSSGCNPASQTDAYQFPRLTWAVPVNNTPNQWCNVVGAPSYKMWRSLKQEMSWESSFQRNEHLYPWSGKMKKAVWRGSTTSNRGLYGELQLNETPRGQLVQKGKGVTTMDVAFHKLVGKYTEMEHTVATIKDPIPQEQMMKYKAIIDIDGNNWSARFNSLLCYNSVIVKIVPDFVESSFLELIPGVHYLPSSLENVTQVVDFAIDEGNDARMRQIVANANSWCKENMIREKLARSAVEAIQAYQVMLNDYDHHWNDDWHNSSVLDGIDDLVQCNL